MLSADSLRGSECVTRTMLAGAGGCVEVGVVEAEDDSDGIVVDDGETVGDADVGVDRLRWFATGTRTVPCAWIVRRAALVTRGTDGIVGSAGDIGGDVPGLP